MPLQGEEQTSYLLQDYKDRTDTTSATSSTSSSSSSRPPTSPVSATDEKHYGHAFAAYEEEDIKLVDAPTIRRPSWLRRRSCHGGFSIIRSTTGSLLLALLPSFLLSSNGTHSKGELHPTAYLDGLRGVAAFFVFIHHFILDWYPSLSAGYASSETDYRFAQLPLIRVIYSGRGMVALFFVISGYVLSYKTLRQVRRREFAPVLETLTSSVFRRGIRLFLPITVSTLISLIIIRLDWYQQDPRFANLLPIRLDTFWEQLDDWLYHLGETTNPFREIDARYLYGNPYDGHLWTIPVEFRGSLVVFLTLLCVVKARQSIRLLLMTCLTLHALDVTHWDLFLFLSGMLLCEIDWLRQDLSISHSQLPNLTTSPLPSSPYAFLRFLSRKKNLLNHLWTIPLFVLSIHLLCYPDVNPGITPGYIYLTAHLTPFQYEPYTDQAMTQRFWLSIGAVLMTLSLTFSPPISISSLPTILHRHKPETSISASYPTHHDHHFDSSKTLTSLLQYPFTTRLAQYLGRISFALYMMHGPVLYTLGMKIFYLALKPGAEEKYDQWFVVAVVMNGMVCFWVADVFWRAVDRRSVRLGFVVRGWCWVDERVSD